MSAATPSRNRLLAGAAILTVVAVLGGYGLAKLTTPATTRIAAAQTSDRQALYWYDPMVPAQHFDKPGKSPFMDMQLVPRYAESPGVAGQRVAGVRIDPAALQTLGVRLATVERGDFAQTIDAPGTLDFNQRDVAIVQARAAGFVQRVYARAPGDVVAAGAPIADLFVPSWGGAQAEYLAVARTGDAALEAAARQRLRLLGLSDAVVAEMARTGKPKTVVTITTPVGGAIQTLDVRQGMTVALGQTLAQVSGLGTVWLNAAVPEAMGGAVRVGQPVRAELAAFPGETFTGRVSAILPAAQVESHTLQVRIELANRSGRLRPGMFATVHLDGDSHPGLSVASEAVIRTGKRTLVMLAGDGGRFQPVEIQVGREQGDRTEILAGLEEGQKVVASGQFLIDSEANLAGIQARPLSGTAMAAPTLYETRGRIETLSGDQITLSHEPVPAIGWPAMTMTFKLSPPTLAKGYKVGDRVAFRFEQKPEGSVIRELASVGAAK